VDGVLNPFKSQIGFTKHIISVLGESYLVYLNTEHGSWLKTLAKDTNSGLVWGSSWQQYANVHISPRIKLPKLPYLDLDGLPDRKFSESLGSVKARAAKNYAGNDKFVFFDDESDLGYYLKGSNGMHLVVEPHTGLTAGDIQIARQYLLS
jgi:hypothetical protein